MKHRRPPFHSWGARAMNLPRYAPAELVIEHATSPSPSRVGRALSMSCRSRLGGWTDHTAHGSRTTWERRNSSSSPPGQRPGVRGLLACGRRRGRPRGASQTSSRRCLSAWPRSAYAAAAQLRFPLRMQVAKREEQPAPCSDCTGQSEIPRAYASCDTGLTLADVRLRGSWSRQAGRGCSRP